MLLFSISTFIFANIFALIGKTFFKKDLNLLSSIIVGIFLFGLFNIVFSLFFKLTSLLYFICIIFFIVISLRNFSSIKHKEYITVFLLSLIASLFSNNIEPGYDAGLYHFPFQNWIADNGISFGLVNFNHRFANSSLLNFINAPLWIGNDPFLLINISLIFYLIFFLKIIDFLESEELYLKLVGLISILTFPLWYRYQTQNFGLVDVPFSILYFILVTQLMPSIISSSTQKDINILYINIILFCLVISFKMSGILVCLIFIIYILKKNIIKLLFMKYRANFVLFFLVIIFFVSWFTHNIIISGCINPYIYITCLNVEWSNLDYIKMLNEQNLEWRDKIVDYKILIQYLKPNYILIILLSLFLNFYILKKLYKNKNNYLIYSFIFIILIFYFYFTSNFQNLENFYKNLNVFNSDQKYEILKYEIISILMVYFISYNLILLLILNKIKKIYLERLNYKYLYIIFVFTFSIFMWLSKNPDPRLGIHFFMLIGPIAIFLTIGTFTLKNYYYKKFYNYILIIFFTLFATNFQFPNLLKNNYQNVLKIKTFKREGFGVKPDLKVNNLCWLEDNCYYYNDDLIINKMFGKIKFIYLN